jgi:ubiquinone/menaquinone biosynthesis C-methylase UbiE
MSERVCPFWLGYFLLSPFRKLKQNPSEILRPWLRPGMTVLDFGSAMGYFSIPMARMVAPDGRVICLDIQDKMLKVLEKRAKRAGVLSLLDLHVIAQIQPNLSLFYDRIDFVLAFSVMHELPDQDFVFNELNKVLKTAGKLMLSEPADHVSPARFDETLAMAATHNFKQIESLSINTAHAALLQKF